MPVHVHSDQILVCAVCMHLPCPLKCYRLLIQEVLTISHNELTELHTGNIPSIQSLRVRKTVEGLVAMLYKGH